MFCTNCGQEIADDAVFCIHCGSKVASNVQVSSPSEKDRDSKQPPYSKNAQGIEQAAPKTVTPAKQMSDAASQRTTSASGQSAYGMQSEQSGKNVQSVRGKGKTGLMIALSAVVLCLLAGGAYFIVQNQMRLQAAQEQAEQALAEAQQAQQAAEEALLDKELAEEKAEQAQKDAETAKKDAEEARAQAEAHVAEIVAAIKAAQGGSAIAFDGYIFPSDREYITDADLVYFDQETALLARNEIYARHGYIFQTPYIQNYFSAQSWYYPDKNYDGTGLSKIEQANAEKILSYEKERGWQ